MLFGLYKRAIADVPSHRNVFAQLNAIDFEMTVDGLRTRIASRQ
jgi:hypothetical protein